MQTKKVLLAILDGWGIGDGSEADAIHMADPVNIKKLETEYPHAVLSTSGEDVGLPHGQMGNSEVGHLNIGAGRIVYQDLVKINKACADGSMAKNPEITAAFKYASDSAKQVHFMGLVSDGGVHSSMEHLMALCDIAKGYGLQDRMFVHCFMDGRDTDPHSGAGFIRQLEDHLKVSGGRIASVIGRYYALDRDHRWERVKVAYDMLINGEGKEAIKAETAILESYEAGVTDEFIKPIVMVGADGKPLSTLHKGDVVVFFNFRNDRARELTMVLTQENMPEYGMKTIPLYYCTMTPYDATFKGMHVLFDKDNVDDPIGEVVSKAGLKQLRIAETEKYPHVTFFLNGGREDEFKGEERILIPSPKVATYDLKPEMSAYEIKDAVIEAMDTQRFDFICLSFANGDMVGHTGIYEAVLKAVRAVDECLGEVVRSARANGYEVVIISDHGNADHVANSDGSPNTAHSLNKVPIIVVSDRVAGVADGVLADVAPTVLQLIGVGQPEKMTGHSLVTFKDI